MSEILYLLGLTEEERRTMPIPDYSDEERYKTTVGLREMESLLGSIKQSVRKGSFVVLDGNASGDKEGSRAKNADFMRVYGLYERRAQQDFLLSLDAEEFCHAVKTNDGRLLYVFCADRTLYRIAQGEEMVRVYVKHDYAQQGKGFDVVVSLHKLERPIVRAFGG